MSTYEVLMLIFTFGLLVCAIIKAADK
ncbi:putative holin-like toxin [Schleiferilactobacillus harbinensis]